MPWPSRSDYTQAIRDYPHISILDPTLRGRSPRRGDNNDLISYSGGFSTVFPVGPLSNTYALRCWIADIGDVETRYRAISDYLIQCRLPYFVDFAYVPEGILVGTDRYPITRMEWAEGETLCDFIEQNLHDAWCLKTAAVEFQKMVETLHNHQISHGDLQDGNILLKRNGTDIEIKLIDYDSLFVPALRGQPDNIVGLPEYQHPQRVAGGGQANEKVDYFSEVVIYLSLLGLAEKPDLWSQFGDRTEKGLLFMSEDFENSDQSDGFQELENLSPHVKQLALKLKEFCAKPSIDQLDPLEAVLPQTSPAQAAYNQGLTYLHNNRYNEAMVEFDKAIGLDPNYTEAYQGLGLAHFQVGNFSEAKMAVEAALRIDPHYQPAIQLLDAIKSSITPSVTPAPPPTGTSGQTSTNPTSQSSPPVGASRPGNTTPVSQVLRSQLILQNIVLNRWRYIAGTLACALVAWIIVFAMQISEEGEIGSEIETLRNQLAKSRGENQKLRTEIVSLRNRNRNLQSENQKLRNRNIGNSFQDQRPQSQLVEGGVSPNPGNDEEDTNNQIPITHEQTNEADFLDQNQGLQNQPPKSNTEQDKSVIVPNEKVEYPNQSQGLPDGMVEDSSQNQMLQSENEKFRSENQMLRSENEQLRSENTELRGQLHKPPPVLSSGGDQLHAAPLQEIFHDNRPRVRPTTISKNNQGYIAFNRSQHTKAIELFEDAIKSDPQSAVAYYNLGSTYIVIKEYTEAVNYLRESVTLDPKFKEAHYNLALAYLRWGYRQEGKKAAQAALNIDKNYQLAHEFLEVIK